MASRLIMFYYNILRGTQIWLIIDSRRKQPGSRWSMITERSVHYIESDIKAEYEFEYHFWLPENNKSAEWLIVKKCDVAVTRYGWDNENY